MPNETFAVFDTSEGKFKAKLYADKTPRTVENFVGLADGTNTGKPFFDGTVFHRVIPDFMIQGGDPEGTGRGGPGYRFEDEVPPDGPAFDRPGLLAMANAGPGTNGSQFFVTVGVTPWLNGKHTIFGEVSDGMEVVEAIAAAPTGAQDRPVEDVVLERVDIS